MLIQYQSSGDMKLREASGSCSRRRAAAQLVETTQSSMHRPCSNGACRSCSLHLVCCSCRHVFADGVWNTAVISRNQERAEEITNQEVDPDHTPADAFARRPICAQPFLQSESMHEMCHYGASRRCRNTWLCVGQVCIVTITAR